jgi:hypothetical protein
MKLLSAGFGKEALELCEAVAGKPEVHKNVLLTLAQIRGRDEEEGRTLDKTINKLKPINEFYALYGRGLTFATPAVIAKKWNAGECELNVTVNELSFTAKGTFQRSNLLTAGLGPFFIKACLPSYGKSNIPGKYGVASWTRASRENVSTRERLRRSSALSFIRNRRYWCYQTMEASLR